jgi:hypothetical protein
MSNYHELQTLIARVRRRWFALVALRTAGAAMASAAVPVAAGVALDWLIHPEGGALILLASVTAAAATAASAMVVWRARRRPDDRQVARFIEERVAGAGSGPPLDDTLVSAVDAAARSHGTDGFQNLLVAQAIARLREVAAADIVPSRALYRAVAEGAAGFALLFLACFAAQGPWSRAIETGRITFVPHSITIEVTPGNAQVLAGGPLRIRASIRGGNDRLRRLTPTLTVWTGTDRRTVDMTNAGDSFEFGFESVDRSFSYRVAVGAALSREYAVKALFAPRVQRIDVRYQYPPFTGLPPRDDHDTGDIYAPTGTRVQLQIHTDKPIVAGELAFGRAGTAPLRAITDRMLQTDLVLSAEDSYRVKLSDRDGLRSRGDTEYFIRLVDDRPPDVRILRPSADESITPLEEVAIEARADDDYGIAQFDLVYSVAGRPERSVPFARVTGTSIEKVGLQLLAAEDLHVRPGDMIAYYARARDVARGKKATEAKSDIFFLEVKPFNEEFVAAPSQAMSGGAGAQLEALITAQKEIINATWNLERRSSAGRSAADVKAVAEAQAQLKQRAEQIAVGSRRPRRGIRAAQQVAPTLPRLEREQPADSDPVAAAVEAMARALQQLEEQRTREAIPHEMSALHGLLQAQAEMRRRQVTQQQAGGGGGSGRQGEDLSALFDKELQRQQRTNYETRSQVEERPEQPSDDSAVDRIRDLAKRQEELSRRQRELAAAVMAEEERKRQLEKLTREQSELRDEVDELARQMGRQSAQQTPGGTKEPQGSRQGPQRPGGEGRGHGEAARSEMRSASEQMQSAASDLRRENPDAAAANGERAAEQLRRVEQQMRGATARARQRAEGDLQLEAQQIADAQRRVAAEAGRLDRSGTAGGADARGRLAAEKEKLADRIDELQKAAQRVGKDVSQGAAAASARDAAQEIEQQRIAGKMRESARTLRESGGPRQAEREQQLVRALDGIVDKLGGDAGQDARHLAEQLEESRSVRERLNELERRIREAEAQAAGGRAGQPGTQVSQAQRGPGGTGKGGADLQQLRDEYARQLQRARQALGQNGQGDQRSGPGMSTPEHQEFSRSAPGTEAFKQDFTKWESLRKQIDLALEKYDAALSARLARKLSEDRLSAGGSERVPDAYERIIAKYYESLAKVKK